ncbi:MAG: PAS domain S-box protein [bacterium]|nr:PAS domain S-box protein [bacterium]
MMEDEKRTKKELINELSVLRGRLAELEQLEIGLKRAETSALDHAEYASNIIATIRDPFLVLDAEMKVISANGSFYDAFSVKPEETAGRLIYDLGNRQWDIPALRELLEDIIQKNSKFNNYEVEHLFPGTGRKIMLLNARRMQRKDSGEQLILLAMEDVTERRQLEKELRESEETFRHTFETSRDGLLLVEPQTGEIKRVNPAIVEILDRPAGELVGKNLWDVGLLKETVDVQGLMRKLKGEGFIFYDAAPLKTRQGLIISADIHLVDRARLVQCNVRNVSERKKTADALIESEEKFRTIFENVTDGILMTDMEDKRFFLANGTICRMLGYTKEEINQLGVMDIHPEKDLPYVIDQLERQARGEFTLAEGIPLKRKDGSIFYADANSAPVQLAGKTYLIGVFRDITRLKESSLALRREKEFSERLVQLSPAIIVGLDKDRKIRRFNSGAESISGYKSQEVLGRDWFDIFFRPEWLKDMERLWEDAWGEDIHIYTNSILTKDGSERTISWSNSTISDEGGKPILQVCIGVDVTEQKRHEKDMQEKVRQLEEARASMLYMLEDLNSTYAMVKRSSSEWVATFDTISDPIFIHNGDFRVTRANRAYQKMAGLPFKELIGKSYWELFPKDCGPTDACRKALKLQEAGIEEIKDLNSEKIFRARYYPVTGESEGVKYSIHVMEDITEVKKAQEMLVQSAKLASVGELAANVAHEINNPMTAILGYSSLILEELDKDSPYYEDIKTIEQESHRIKNIVRNLLDFSRHRKVDMKMNDIRQVLKESISLVGHSARNANVAINVVESEEIPLLMIDADQIKQVIVNLISNAIHAMPDGGMLTISAETSGKEQEAGKESVLLRFKDTGCGIPEGNLSRIFDPFFSSKGEKGTGLGLSISYGIIKNHGGDIVVEKREGEGEGAEFTVILPVPGNNENSQSEEKGT